MESTTHKHIIAFGELVGLYNRNGTGKMKSVLFILVFFTSVTSILSGVLMISRPNGGILNLQLSLLDGSPFKDFLVPGIILTIFVGGVNMLAVIYTIRRNPSRYNWDMAGGIVISGWVMAQMILIHAVQWLQFLYLGIGILIILLAYQLKGKWAA